MGARHVVGRGECIASIAERYGFFPDTLWDHPDNAELKRRRVDPYVLEPGDVVVIPDLTLRYEPCAVERRHHFRRRGVPAKLRLVLMDDGSPRAHMPYTLEVAGRMLSGVTDARGRLEHWVPPNAKSGVLTLFPPVESDDAFAARPTRPLAADDDEIDGPSAPAAAGAAPSGEAPAEPSPPESGAGASPASSGLARERYDDEDDDPDDYGDDDIDDDGEGDDLDDLGADDDELTIDDGDDDEPAGGDTPYPTAGREGPENAALAADGEAAAADDHADAGDDAPHGDDSGASGDRVPAGGEIDPAFQPLGEEPMSPSVERYPIHIGHLYPMTTNAGVRARLESLDLIDPGDDDERLPLAIALFQEQEGLPPSGHLDDATRARLHRRHRC